MKNSVTFKPIILVVAVMAATPASGMGWLRSWLPWRQTPRTGDLVVQTHIVTPEQIHCLNRLLFEAVKSNNPIQAQTMLLAGADPNAPNKHQATPLHIAARGGHADVAKLLIAAGADQNTRGKDQATPLHWAAVNGHANVAKVLIENDATIDAQEGKLQATPLHFAARGGHADVAKLLIAAGADQNTRGKGQCTPLYLAAWFGHKDVAELFIDKGATIGARERQQETPLHLAAWLGHKDVAKLLIAAGADPEACSGVIPASDTNHHRTPLQQGAVRTRRPDGQTLPPDALPTDALRRLIELGASLAELQRRHGASMQDGSNPSMASWAWALQ